MKKHPHFWAYAALISVCIFWGTTYLAIRMALESIQPMTLVASRFVLSGSILLGGAKLAGMPMPKGRALLWTGLYGVTILGVGNGCLTLAELWIPSGLAALFIAPSPFWMVGLEAALPGGEKLRPATLAGMLLGLCGAALLVAPSVMEHGFGGNVWKGFLVLQAGSASWSLGSILQRRQQTHAHPIVNGAVQQLAAGLAFVLPALLLSRSPSEWTLKAGGALLWLVIFGSVVGYSSYIYSLSHLPVALVSIYSYINPIVAAVLGWVFYREPFGMREALAMAVIFLGVAVVKHSTPRPAR